MTTGAPPYAGVLTGMPRPQLLDWLREVRRVAALEGAAALEGVDTLLWSIREAVEARDARAGAREFDDEREDEVWLAEDLERVRDATERLRSRLGQPEAVHAWQPTALRDLARELGRHVSQRAGATMAAAVAEVQADALAVAMEAERRSDRTLLDRALAQPLHNANSVTTVLALVERAMEALWQRGGVTPEVRALARQARERAARFRAQRKLEEADVAVAGGKATKAAKLRAEARVVLAQDWARAFPGAEIPQG